MMSIKSVQLVVLFQCGPSAWTIDCDIIMKNEMRHYKPKWDKENKCIELKKIVGTCADMAKYYNSGKCCIWDVGIHKSKECSAQ